MSTKTDPTLEHFKSFVDDLVSKVSKSSTLTDEEKKDIEKKVHKETLKLITITKSSPKMKEKERSVIPGRLKAALEYTNTFRKSGASVKFVIKSVGVGIKEHQRATGATQKVLKGFGTVVVETYEREDETCGVRLRMKFVPLKKSRASAGIAADEVGYYGFVQVCRGAKKMKAKMKESPDTWDEYYTNSRDIDTNPRTADFWFVDAGAQRNPFFGITNTSNDPAELVKERRKEIGNIGKGGNTSSGKLGYIKKNGDTQPATLFDRPGRTFTRHEHFEVEHIFETALLVLSGPYKGTCLGAWTWGYSMKHKDLNYMAEDAAGLVHLRGLKPKKPTFTLKELKFAPHVSNNFVKTYKCWNSSRGGSKVPSVKKLSETIKM